MSALDQNRPSTGYPTDPNEFCRLVLGVTLWEAQRRVLADLSSHPQVAVRSAHGVGKSFLAACAALWWCYSFRPSLVLTTAPSRRQVESILWPELARLWQRATVRLPGRLLRTRLDAGADQIAFGFTAREPEKAAGLHAENLLVIVDEASGVDDRLFEVLAGARTSAHCALLLIGNPTRPSGQFYEAFRSEEWRTTSISAYDTPNFGSDGVTHPWLVTPDWAEARKREWGADSDPFRVRVLGEFPRQSADSLIPLAWVEAAENHTETLPALECHLGLDVARYGDCETVLVERRGDEVTAIAAWTGVDLMGTVGRVVERCRRKDVASVTVDTVGVGGGVYDRLDEMKREGCHDLSTTELYGFESGGRSAHPDFESRRDQSYWELRARFEEGRLSLSGSFPRLTGQLTGLRYGYTSRGKLKVESKDDLRRRGRVSPDWADALMLAFSRPAQGLWMGGSSVTERAGPVLF